jgi:hypothetical protein
VRSAQIAPRTSIASSAPFDVESRDAIALCAEGTAGNEPADAASGEHADRDRRELGLHALDQARSPAAQRRDTVDNL